MTAGKQGHSCAVVNGDKLRRYRRIRPFSVRSCGTALSMSRLTREVARFDRPSEFRPVEPTQLSPISHKGFLLSPWDSHVLLDSICFPPTCRATLVRQHIITAGTATIAVSCRTSFRRLPRPQTVDVDDSGHEVLLNLSVMLRFISSPKIEG